MKSTLTRLITALAVGAVVAVSAARANGINFSSAAGTTSSNGAQIKFDGASHFSFSNATAGTNNGFAFVVTNDDLAGDALGLKGVITGTYTIGAISVDNAGTPFNTADDVSTAPVTGSGLFKIQDGASNWFSANVTWQDIKQVGTGSTINTTGFANLTGITYTGTSLSLQELRDALSGASTTISFTFNPAVALSALKSGAGTHKTSFSGSTTALPEGGETLMMLGLGLSGLAFLRRKRA
jgi:hypothetical protein